MALVFAAANALKETRKKSGPGFCSGAAKVISKKLLWSSWRWGPLTLFLSALRLHLPALSWSRRRRSASWLAARLTIRTLPSFSSTSRFAWTCTGRRRGRRSIESGLPAFFSASRFTGSRTRRRRARLAIARLSSLCATSHRTRTGANWRRCSATLDLGRFTTALLWQARRPARLPRAWSCALPHAS